jgi:hypothetical protein
VQRRSDVRQPCYAGAAFKYAGLGVAVAQRFQERDAPGIKRPPAGKLRQRRRHLERMGVAQFR